MAIAGVVARTSAVEVGSKPVSGASVVGKGGGVTDISPVASGVAVACPADVDVGPGVGSPGVPPVGIAVGGSTTGGPGVVGSGTKVGIPIAIVGIAGCRLGFGGWLAWTGLVMAGAESRKIQKINRASSALPRLTLPIKPRNISHPTLTLSSLMIMSGLSWGAVITLRPR